VRPARLGARAAQPERLGGPECAVALLALLSPHRKPAAWPGPPCDQAASFQRRYGDARLDGGGEHLLHTEREDEMPESVYKVIELIGTSNESWEKAAANAVEQAAKSLRELRVAEVVELDMQLDAKGKVEAYRAKVNVSFKFEGS
jgi:dodecin